MMLFMLLIFGEGSTSLSLGVIPTVPNIRCPISEFLGWGSSYQQCWLPFRDFEFVIKRHGFPEFKDLVGFHKTAV